MFKALLKKLTGRKANKSTEPSVYTGDTAETSAPTAVSKAQAYTDDQSSSSATVPEENVNTNDPSSSSAGTLKQVAQILAFMNHATHAVDEDRDRHEEASSERNDLLHPLGANARIHRDTEEFSASDDTEF